MIKLTWWYRDNQYRENVSILHIIIIVIALQSGKWCGVLTRSKITQSTMDGIVASNAIQRDDNQALLYKVVNNHFRN